MRIGFIVPVRGISNYQGAAVSVCAGDAVRLTHDQANRHDPNAVAIATLSGQHLGYVPATVAEKMIRQWGPGATFDGEAVEVVGGGSADSTTGVRVRVTAYTGANEPDADALTPDDAAMVHTRSGRELGTLIAVDGDDVVVATAAGSTRFPAHLVAITENA